MGSGFRTTTSSANNWVLNILFYEFLKTNTLFEQKLLDSAELILGILALPLLIDSLNQTHVLSCFSNMMFRHYEWDYRWMDYPPQTRDLKHPFDHSVATYKGHSVLRTLIRCYFSPEYRLVLKHAALTLRLSMTTFISSSFNLLTY